MQLDSLSSVFGEFCALSMNMSEDELVGPGREGRQLPASSVLAHKLKIELPPVFKGDGTEFFTNWSRRFEVAVRAFHSPGADVEGVLAAVLPTRLADAAFLYWDTLPPATQDNYALVKKHLLDVFGPKHTLPFFQTYVNARPRRQGESLEVYCADITRLVMEAFPDYDTNAIAGEKFRRFVAGVDQALQTKIHEMGATTMEAALQVASRCERARIALQLNSKSPPPPTASTPEKVAMVRSQPTEDRLLQAVEQLTLTVSSLKSDVQQLREKNTYLTQRIEPRYDRASARDGSQRRPRSPSPHFYQAQRRPMGYRSPDRYAQDSYYSSQRSVSPVVSSREAFHARGFGRHVSPEHRYDRQHSRSDTDRWRRSPSPSPWQSRDTSPHYRRSVRFKSPEPENSRFNVQGNYE